MNSMYNYNPKRYSTLFSDSRGLYRWTVMNGICLKMYVLIYNTDQENRESK